MKKIARVIKWGNGMIMVFDEDGIQMPEYQGRYAEVKERILANIPKHHNVLFETGIWHKGTQNTPREDW